VLHVDFVGIAPRHQDAFTKWAVRLHLHAITRRRTSFALPNECFELVLKEAAPDIVSAEISRRNRLNAEDLLIAG